MAAVNLGRVGLVLHGDWSGAVTYAALDVVAYDGNSWVAKRSNTNVEPTTENDDDWQLISNNSTLVATVQGYKEDAEVAATTATTYGNAVVSAVAPIESTSTASQVYATGDFFIYNGTLYIASASISQGGTITPNTNCTAIPKGISSEVASLKSAINGLSDTYVALDGENQVTPQNISGVTFDKTESTTLGPDIFSETYLGESGYYASVNTGVNPPVIAHSSLSSYRWYAIPVDGASTYSFTKARFACLAKGNTVGSEAVGTTEANIEEITATGANYLILSYSSSVTSIEVHKQIVGYTYSNFVMPSWMRNGLDAKKKYIANTGSFSASGDKILLANARSDLRKGTRLVFECAVTSGTDFDIGFSVSESAISSAHNIIRITSTSITYNNTSYAHGLTIAGMVQVLFEYKSDATADITLICNGNLFKQSVEFANSSVAVPYVESKGLVATDCIFTFTCLDFNKTIWIFGDSYVQYQSARWTYYLHQYGYDENVLINGFAGEGSVNARVSANKLFAFAEPKYAVWCMGMNDGSDTDSSTPSSTWSSNKNDFLTYCANNGVTPIFGTIPTVPEINHEAKNAWIRARGYRYIDFAKAVGANSSGVWYAGMLSQDNVHPTEAGAKALFARVLLDLPEVMISD